MNFAVGKTPKVCTGTGINNKLQLHVGPQNMRIWAGQNSLS